MSRVAIHQVKYLLVPIFILAYIIITMAACTHEVQPFTIKQPNYNPIPLNVVRISVVNEDVGGDTNVAGLPFSPQQELLKYLRNKFKAVGQSGELTIFVRKAGLDSSERDPRGKVTYRAAYNVVLRFTNPKVLPTVTELKFNLSNQVEFIPSSMTKKAKFGQLGHQIENLLNALQADIDAKIPVNEASTSPYIE